jgi:hypothetical protein
MARIIYPHEVTKGYDPSEPLPMSFDELIDEYHTASDRADYAEFVLLVYHQLICLADLENLRAVEEMAKNTYSTPSKTPSLEGGSSWAPLALRPDTGKTAYRHNHITDEKWAGMTFEQRSNWIKVAAQTLGKSIVS